MHSSFYIMSVSVLTMKNRNQIQHARVPHYSCNGEKMFKAI